MAFRRAAYWKSIVTGLQASSSSSSNFSTLTLGASSSSKSKFPKGDMLPVLMAVGLISLSAGFGVFTAWHQLRWGPNLYVRKSRRETIPEVVEPEHVAEEAEKFVKQSFFRKVAHIQDFDRQNVMPDPLHGDIFTKVPKVETLRDVGVDPAAAT